MEEVTHNTEITDGGERKRVLRVDVIIPAYKPGKKFSRLLKMLSMQTYPIGKIIVMNTEKAYWNEKGFEGIGNLEVHHLSKEEFDHGATRNRGARYSRADIMVFMTDDAVPADEKLIENLTAAFEIDKGEKSFTVKPKGKSLTEVLTAFYGTEVTDCENKGYTDMFTIIVTSYNGEASVKLNFTIAGKVVGVVLDREVIVF